MNFWNREQVTGLDCVWDFVDNVSPLPSYSTFIRKGSFFKQGRNNMSEVNYLTGDPA